MNLQLTTLQLPGKGTKKPGVHHCRIAAGEELLPDCTNKITE